MSTWIIRCSNPRCRHVTSEDEWVLKPSGKKMGGLDVKQSHCPKCDCKSYYKATEKEIAQHNATQRNTTNR